MFLIISEIYLFLYRTHVNLITPEYEYQEKHHLFFGKPEEERRTNRGECALRM